MEILGRQPIGEQQRSMGWYLASKVRILREELRGGRNQIGNLKELRDITLELATLFSVSADYGIIAFEVRDTGETDENASGFTFGRRIVEVSNPNAEQGASKKINISLLNQPKESLTDLGVSEILPPAYGNI